MADVMSAVVEHTNNMSTNVMALLLPVINAVGVLANPGLILNSVVILGSGFLHSAFVFYEITSDRLEKEKTLACMTRKKLLASLQL